MSSITRACFLIATAGLTSPLFGQATFVGLGRSPSGDLFVPTALSANGEVVGGIRPMVNGFQHAMLWTEQGGFLELGTPPGYFESTIAGVNADGSVAIGFCKAGGDRRACRWTAATGMEALGLPPGADLAIGTAVNGDGSVVTGTATHTGLGQLAFRWTAAGGSQSLGVAPGGQSSLGFSISEDGDAIVGNSSGGFRWSPAAGFHNLGTLPGWSASDARAVSADGAVIAGFNYLLPGGFISDAFRWTLPGGMKPLPSLPGMTRTQALAVSGDGWIIGGRSSFETTTLATIWAPQLGVVDLNEYLTTLGVSLTGWTLTGVVSMSHDGRTLVGVGRHDFVAEGWIVRLPGLCFANCDGSTAAPVLNISDFICFLNRFAAGSESANCDGSTVPPVLNVSDFVCFQARFAAGCT